MIRGMQRDGYVIRKKYQMGIETDMHGVLQRETRGLEAPMYMERRTHIHTQRKNEKNEHRASEADFERHIATSRNKYGDTEEYTHTRTLMHTYRSIKKCRCAGLETCIDPEKAPLETDRPRGKSHAD